MSRLAEKNFHRAAGKHGFAVSSLVVRKGVAAASAVGILFWMLWVPAASAQGKLDQCDDVLRGDLFNRAMSNKGQSASEKQLATAAFFSASEDDAYKEYKMAYANNVKQGSSGHVETPYGAGGFAQKYGRELSRDEFSREYSKARSEQRESSTSDKERQDSLISNYSSAIRDPNTIKAWESCMARSQEPGLYAFGYRTEGTSAYLKVLWVPGSLGAALPSINIKFVPTSEKIQVVNTSAEPTVISVGSGAAFAIRNKDPDAKLPEESFVVVVNGDLVVDGKRSQSFVAEAKVPATTVIPASSTTVARWPGNDNANRGETIADRDPLAKLLRDRKDPSHSPIGFVTGLGAAEGQTLPGPGKDRLRESLDPKDRSSFQLAVDYSLSRNNNLDLAERGAAVLRSNHAAEEVRSHLTLGLAWLGFDIAAGIFGSVSDGGLGNTSQGPGSSKVRDGLTPEGQTGFRAAVAFFIGQR